MPPKRKSFSTKKLKNAAPEHPLTKRVKNSAGREKDGARARAKICNQHFLKDALNVAMTQVHGDSFTSAGLNFVAANTSRCSEGLDRTLDDPLKLSYEESPAKQQTGSCKRAKGTHSNIVLYDHKDNPIAQPQELDDHDVIESSQPQSTFRATKVAAKKASFRRENHGIELTTADIYDELQELSQKRAFLEFDNISYDSENGSLEEWEPSGRGIAIKCAIDADLNSSAENCASIWKAPAARSAVSHIVTNSILSPRKLVETAGKGKTTLLPRQGNVDKLPEVFPKERTVSAIAATSPDISEEESLEEWGPRRTALRVHVDSLAKNAAHPSYRNAAASGTITESGPSTRKAPLRKLVETRSSGNITTGVNSGILPPTPPDPSKDGSLEEWGPQRATLRVNIDSVARNAAYPSIAPASGITAENVQHAVEIFRKNDTVAPEDDTTDDGYRSKYYQLLHKFNAKCKAMKQLKEKYEKNVQKLAEMKDLVVYANVEAKKAKMDPNAQLTFTTDPEIDMTINQIDQVNKAFKSDMNFGQNLALFFYGAQTLKEMSVTGTATHRFKNAQPKTGISPKKLSFIHEKVQQRVAARVGVSNLSLINAVAHPTIVNKAIGEKIANLNKATKYADARRLNRDMNQDA